MKQFSRIIREINVTISSIMLFEAVLDALLIFLGLYMFLALFNFYPAAALVPALVYLFVMAYIKLMKYKPVIIEGKYQTLREKLRTAFDNYKSESQVEQELEKEVVRGLKDVKVSEFVQARKAAFKVAGVIVLCFLLLVSGRYNVVVLDVDKVIKGDMPLFPSGTAVAGESDNLINVTINDSDGIYGLEQVAKLGNKELNIKLSQGNYKVGVKDSGEAEEREFNDIFPKEVFVKTSEESSEKLPPEEQAEIIKTYFDKLTR